MTEPTAPTVTLRPLLVRDADVIGSWAADPQFCREADWTVGLSVERHVDFWEHVARTPPAGLIRLAAVVEAELVGYVDLHGDEPGRRELGFTVGGRERWGRGLGVRVAAAGLSWGFRELGLDEVWAEAYDANERSVRILRRLGMRETGRGDAGTYLDRPTYYRQFTITASDR
ncbi:GNAT family N-acetyltransferase [Georgenia subflava]|uniref:GNAT family N-acetyltransferase n=1 Tax=Georgenia subflava TaxID=1622177 RepID=A0A6N7EHT4_9MICO|nr:GNAT family N-acetyltransferase [Georgenia subflava]MPV35716.1 GNAT family N-acetyltransferase [Georgenia subflava]